MARRARAWWELMLALAAGVALAGLRWPDAGAWVSWMMGSMAHPAGSSAKPLQRPDMGEE